MTPLVLPAEPVILLVGSLLALLFSVLLVGLGERLTGRKALWFDHLCRGLAVFLLGLVLGLLWAGWSD